jgi:hypothetical protein
MAKQVVPLHWAAYFLDPTNAGTQITPLQQKQLMEFLESYVPKERYDAVIQDFFNYYNKEGDFQPGNSCWKHLKNPNLFWSINKVVAPELADLARRLHHTQANSVPSERSFSIAKLIHSRTRASTDPKRVDKQTFVYINKRTFARVRGGFVGAFDWSQLTEEERLEWEQSIVDHDYIESKKRSFEQMS